MNTKKLISLLASKYHDEDFPEKVQEVQQLIIQGKLPKEWGLAYDKYCLTNKPGTDEFSYSELGDVLIEELASKDIIKSLGFVFSYRLK